MKFCEMTFAVFYYFRGILENLLFLIAKCVEIYVHDNTGDVLTFVQLSQVVCIVWTD